METSDELTVVVEYLSQHVDAFLFRFRLYIDPRADRQKAVIWALECLRAGTNEAYLPSRGRAYKEE